MRRLLVLVLQLSCVHGAQAHLVDEGCFDKHTAMSDTIFGEVDAEHTSILSNSTPVQCSWRVETEQLVDRIYFTITYQHFAGDDSLEMFSVGSKGELRSLTAGRGFSARDPIPREMVLYNATSAVVVVLTSSSNSTRFVMEYEGIARQPDWMRKSPWIAFWIAIGVVFLAVWSCVALYILFVRHHYPADHALQPSFMRRRTYPELQAYERNEQALEERRSSALAMLPVETYEKRRLSQRSQSSQQSARSLICDRDSTRNASTASVRCASVASADQPEGGSTPTMQRPPLVAEEDAHSQAEPESDGDAAAGFEGGDARDACGLCEDQRGEGVGPAAKASAEAVLPPTLDGEEEPEECCLCMETFSDDALVSVLPCDHFFHQKCISTWFDANKYHARTCPLCKRDPLADFWREEEAAAARCAAALAATTPEVAAPPETTPVATAAPTQVTLGAGDSTAARPQVDSRVSSVVVEISLTVLNDLSAADEEV